MKMYVAHSTSFDFQTELYTPLRKSDLNTIHEITLPHEKSGEQFDSKNYLKSCDLMVAEVSYASTGQGIELGWANMYGVPIVCFYKEGTKPSGALKAVSENFFEYKSTDELINKLANYILTFR